MVFLKKVSDPKRFGVPEFDKKNNIVVIEEKPKNPKSTYAVTGVYIYDKDVFEIIKKLKPSERGQLEITDVNNAYIKKGKLTWAELEGYWGDAGTYASLFEANKYWAIKKGHKDGLE